MEEMTIQHFNPVWREKANFILRVRSETSPKGGIQVWEQLWTRQVTNTTYEICCIPFYLYNVSLGDEVRVNENKQISEVVKYSGHYTFRVYFSNLTDPHIREAVVNDVTEMKCLVEWYSENLLAIDASSIMTAQAVADYLQDKEYLKLLQFETGKL